MAKRKLTPATAPRGGKKGKRGASAAEDDQEEDKPKEADEDDEQDKKPADESAEDQDDEDGAPAAEEDDEETTDAEEDEEEPKSAKGRIRAILKCQEAKTRPGLAQTLALDTSLSVAEARKALKAAAPETAKNDNPLKTAMADVDNPTIKQGGAKPTAADALLNDMASRFKKKES